MKNDQISMIEEGITFTRKEGKYTQLGKSVGLKTEEWLAVRDIAEKSGMTMTDVATELVRFALNHVQWK
jgi:hypothetical protein